MSKTIRNSSALVALLTSAAFANPAAATPAAPVAVKKAGAPKADERIAPVFGTVRTDIKPPVSTRGAKSELGEKLAALETVGASIGIGNKSKKQISSQLSKINNAESNHTAKIGADGNPVMRVGEPIKDAGGNTIGHQPSPGPEMVKVKEFTAYDVNPATDPDKATVRIFRTK